MLSWQFNNLWLNPICSFSKPILLSANCGQRELHKWTWTVLFFDLRPPPYIEGQLTEQPRERSPSQVSVLEPSWTRCTFFPFPSASGQIRHLDSCFFPVLRTQPSTLEILSFGASVCHRMIKFYFSCPEQCSMCSYRWSQHIPHICSLYILSLLCCQDWFLNPFLWFLKGSWHHSHSFGLADFASTTSLSMIAFMCSESRRFGTLEMVTSTWRSLSISFVYNTVSVDLRSCWLYLSLSFSSSSFKLLFLFQSLVYWLLQMILRVSSFSYWFWPYVPNENWCLCSSNKSSGLWKGGHDINSDIKLCIEIIKWSIKKMLQSLR